MPIYFGVTALSKTKEEKKSLETMADMLRQGETLTGLACPVCSTPLFRLRKGDLWCAKCQKKVIVVKEGEEAKLTSTVAMESLESTLLAKIGNLQKKMEKTDDPEELQRLDNTLSGLLANLEKVRKAEKT